MAAAAGGGAREIVILLDQSASMGYGDHWTRAKDAARTAVRGLGADDRATLVLFNKNAEENMRATADRTRLEAAINAAKVGSGATRYGPALKLAESILSRSPIKRREAILISDFQRSGWSGSEEVPFPGGDDGQHGVGRVAGHREPRGAVGRVRALVVLGTGAPDGDRRPQQQGRRGAEGRPGHADHRRPRNPDREGDRARRTLRARCRSRSSRCPSPNVRGSVRAGTDPMPADNTFNFVLAPSEPVSLVIVDSGDRAASSLFLAKALSIGTTPVFQVDVTPASRLTPAALDKRVGRHPQRHDVPARRRRRRR